MATPMATASPCSRRWLESVSMRCADQWPKSRGRGRGEGAVEVLRAEAVHAVLYAEPGIALGEHGGRQTDLTDAAVDDRGRKADGVEHRTTTDDDDVTVAADAVVEAGAADLVED